MRALSLFLAGLAAFARPAVADDPMCDGRWHSVPVGGTQCLDGSQSGFTYICQAAAGVKGPLVINFDGGGACWDGNTCDCRPCSGEGDPRPQCSGAPVGLCSSSDAVQIDNSPSLIQAANSSYSLTGVGRTFREEQTTFHGYAMFDGQYSPFGDGWNYAVIPYCTGDTHAGRLSQTYTTTGNRQGYACSADADCRDPLSGAPGPAGSCQAGLCADVSFTVHHTGYQNDTLELAAIAALFPEPQKVVAIGGSAGAYGVNCNLSQVVGHYPATKMFHMDIAGPPLNPAYAPDFLADTAHWGWYHLGDDGRPVGDTCPMASPPGEQVPFLTADVSYYNQLNFPWVRHAAANSKFDATIAGFSFEFGATPDANGTEWVVANSLTDFLDRYLVSRNPGFNYKLFVPDNECHGYDFDATGPCGFETTHSVSGVLFRDWMNAWLELPSPAPWTNEFDPRRVKMPR